MGKKRTFCVIGIFMFIAIIVSITMPYLFNSKNLISKNNNDHIYKQVYVVDFDNLQNPICIDNNKTDKLNKLISVIDGLDLKKAMKPNDFYNYGLSFTATYKENETSTVTKEVLYIRFYKDNVIGLKNNHKYHKETYYKVQNEKFDIKKVIEELIKE